MSIEMHATKIRIDQLVANALSAIKNRSTDASWSRKVIHASNQLTLLSKSVVSAKTNAQHFGNMHAKIAGKPNQFRIRQSTQSKIGNLDTLQQAVENALLKIGAQLDKERRKSPFEDKTAMELVDALADEISSYDQLLTKVDALAKSLARSNTSTEISVIQNNAASLKTQNLSSGGPSALMMVALTLRLVAMLLANRK